MNKNAIPVPVIIFLLVVAGCTAMGGGEESNQSPGSTPTASSDSEPGSPTAPSEDKSSDSSGLPMPPSSETSDAPKKEGDKPAEGGAALTALQELPVKPLASKTGYSRDAFPHWKDTDGDGCDASDQAVKFYASVELKNKCREVAGVMWDPYSGKEIKWGASRTGVVDLEHIVALSNAWQTGAQSLSLKQREDLANDPLNVIPVSASLNRAKGDKSADQWLPPNTGFHCKYIARQIAVKSKYNLWVTTPEKRTMDEVLTKCANEPLPIGAAPLR